MTAPSYRARILQQNYAKGDSMTVGALRMIYVADRTVVLDVIDKGGNVLLSVEAVFQLLKDTVNIALCEELSSAPRGANDD